MYGVGRGRCGNSYAIPTKGFGMEVLSLDRIDEFVQRFLLHAQQNSREQFRVVAIGCGLAGYTPAEIAPMFRGAPDNVILPPEFVAVLGK